MNGTSGGLRARLVACAMAIIALAPIQAPAGIARRVEAFAPGGLAGSNVAAMQPVTVPARPARVAVVPGTGGREAWAIALSSAVVKGWHTDDPGGQVVFMKYTAATGWQIFGPPVDQAGRVVNPNLYNFAIAPGGEGWAVGAEGVLVHYRPGGRWVVESSRPTTEDIRAISLVGSGSSLAGFAVGDGRTVLRLQGGRWTPDSNTALITADLTAVSATSPDTAWAVSGNGSKEVTVFRRDSGGWSRFLLNKQALEGPHPARVGSTLVVRQAGGASIAATPDGAWIGGVLYVTDASDPFGDDSGRPFVVQVKGATVTTYCAPVWMPAGANPEPQNICDQPFPTARYDVTSLQPLAGGEVFAGGLGLFRFARGRWSREPDSNGYLISISFASKTEGWVASTGTIYGAGGTAYSSMTTLGHWTRRAQAPRIARWPQPNEQTLESVAAASGGDGRALGAGGNGSLVLYEPGVGWDLLVRSGRNAHGVGWSDSSTAWAVGDRGSVYRIRGRSVEPDPASEVATIRTLFGVAFANGRGVAVGANGTILQWDAAGGWRPDPASGRLTTKALYAVTSTPTGFIAVGENATIIEQTGGRWRKGPNLAPMVTRPRFEAPGFYAVAATPSGETFVGGGQSALLRRPAGSSTFAPVARPVEGTVVALGVLRGGLLVSVTAAEQKYVGNRIAAPATTVMALDEAGWHDVQLDAKQSIQIGVDPSQPRDALFAVAVDPSGRTGWLVGGTLVNTESENRHILSHPTGAVYRFDLDGDPSPPDQTWIPDLPKGRAFAFFGETGCLSGPCSVAMGSGTKADVIADQIQREVNMLSQVRGGPEFALFGGDMRSNGHPDELRQFRDYLKRFRIPAYAAMGNRDLFSTRSQSTVTVNTPTSVQQPVPSNREYLEIFSDMPAPWGSGNKPPKGIRPLDGQFYTSDPQSGIARTHYAFDVLDDAGRPAYRVVVLDSSNYQLSSATGQNPQEDQLNTYVPRVLANSGTEQIPTVIALGVPSLHPYYLGFPTWNPATDEKAFNGHIAAGRGAVKGVMQSGFPVNASYVPTELQATTRTRFYVAGGGGRSFELTKNPYDGFYHAWFLATMIGSGAQATLDVRSIPVLDSLALRAKEGRLAPAGNPLRFDGLARFPLGGSTDIGQAKATYMPLPIRGVCGGPGHFDGRCVNQNAMMPQYEFATTDPSIAEFVRYDETLKAPYRDRNGNIQKSSTSGVLCTYKPGTTNVLLRMGLKQVSVPITVTGGFGPCIEKPEFPPEPPEPPEIVDPVEEPERKPFLYFSADTSQGAAALFPPIPAPVVAPAPPGAPGVGRKEEHEVQTETEGHGENQFTALERPVREPYVSASFTAIRHRRTQTSGVPEPILLGAVTALSFMSAAYMVTKRRRRYAWQRDPAS